MVTTFVLLFYIYNNDINLKYVCNKNIIIIVARRLPTVTVLCHLFRTWDLECLYIGLL